MTDEMTIAPLKLFLDEIPLEIQLKRGEEPIKGKYFLREMDGGSKTRYLQGFSKRWKTTAQGDTLENLVDLEADLIACCLWEKDDAGKESPIKIEVIRKFPAAVHKTLYILCRKLCSIGSVEADEAKKD